MLLLLITNSIILSISHTISLDMSIYITMSLKITIFTHLTNIFCAYKNTHCYQADVSYIYIITVTI